jgi:late competence protein required for DNA uptake (superfamily II DNA/RNA helicase)
MNEGNTTCKRCGAEEENGMETDGKYYCSRFCMLEDNPRIVGEDKDILVWLDQQRKCEQIKARMSALKKEASEAGVPWA